MWRVLCDERFSSILILYSLYNYCRYEFTKVFLVRFGTVWYGKG